MADQGLAALLNADLPELLGSRGRIPDALQAIPELEQELLALARSNCPVELRFKALEVYFRRAGDAAMSSPAIAALGPEMAQVYAQALREEALLDSWGLPATVRSSPTSRHLIAFGPAAIQALRPLLGDRTQVEYGGEESSLAELAQVRRCDLAAALILAIRNEPYVNDPKPAIRDKQIAQLIKLLG